MFSYSRVDLPQFPRDPHSRKEVDIPEQFERQVGLQTLEAKNERQFQSPFVWEMWGQSECDLSSIPWYPRTMMNEKGVYQLRME